MIEYSEALDVRREALDIIDTLNLDYLDPNRIHFVRSKGSKSNCLLARVHSLGRIWESVIGVKPSYVIEVLSERYEKMSIEEQNQTLIHELLHIPRSFGGGLRPHRRYVTRRRVKELCALYQKKSK